MKAESILIGLSGKGKNDKQILIEGQLTIGNAALLKKHLLKAIAGHKKIKLVFKNIVKIDLAVMQVLTAFRKNADLQGIELSVESELTDTIKSSLHNTGLQRFFIQN
jgi:anti-anti-sigma regulatory factor